MKSDIVENVTEWESEPYSGGFRGLREFADREFTGAVTQGLAWAFMLNGKVVGVFDGTIDDFEDADGTAYEAPHPGLSLLYAMQETGGETQAKYYTNDTALSEADKTLSSGNFTGYVELSENVLSGDYYVAYYGGKRMSVAFIGNSRKLLTDDEAFERADDEVGIYEVKAVDIEVVDIPEPDDGAAAGAAAVGAAAESDEADAEPDEDETVPDDADETTDEPSAASPVTMGDESTADEEDVESASTEATDVEPARDAEPDAAEPTDAEPADAADANLVEEAEPETEADASREPGDAQPAAPPEEPAKAEPDDREPEPAAEVESESAPEPVETAGTPQEESHGTVGAEDRSEDVFNEEARWRETTSIPALDPSESRSDDQASGAKEATSQQTRKATASKRKQSERKRQASGAAKSSAGADPAKVRRLRQELEEAKDARAQAEREREELESKLESAKAERDEQRERAERLQKRVDELEAEVERLQETLDAAGAEVAAGERTMSPDEALSGTNLFVRYDTKSGGTLEKAHAGNVDGEEVNENLRLEHHTTFESDGLTVAGTPYERFLDESIEYGFVKWVVEDLLYEIRDTGHKAELGDLYDAIPRIDRAELYGTVTVKYQENGEERQEERAFDVVLRDRMGNPLIVANINDSRDAATESMMNELIQSSGQVGETSDSLGAAIFVTSSFFEPQALEATASATGGGFLSRGKKASYVKLSRKRGFHLCLVETRGGEFHVNVPEL